MSGGLRLGGGKYRDCETKYAEGNAKGKKAGTCAKYSKVKQPIPAVSAKRVAAGQCNSWILFYQDYQAKHTNKNWTKGEMMNNARVAYPAEKAKYQKKSNKCRVAAGLPALVH